MAIPTEQLVGLANQVLVGDTIPLEKVAISVFDGWVGPDNLKQLDCNDADERLTRDERHLSFWVAIRQHWPNMLALRPGNKFAIPQDQNAYINGCRIDQNRGSDAFQCAVIPSVGAIYYENWVDTNVLWFDDRSRIRDLLNIAENEGLYVIEYAG